MILLKDTDRYVVVKYNGNQEVNGPKDITLVQAEYSREGAERVCEMFNSHEADCLRSNSVFFYKNGVFYRKSPLYVVCTIQDALNVVYEHLLALKNK